MWLWLLVTLAMGQEKICYSSGLTLLVDTIKGSQTMTVTTVIEGGSSGEDDDQQGAAHLAEHLWFRSSTDGGPSVDVLLHQMGASVNGYTSWDETVYVTMAPADALRSVLALEARRLRDPLAGTEAVFEAERSVVQAELLERYDGMAPGLTGLLATQLEPGHPYTRSVGGSPESVASLTPESVARLVEDQYHPRSATILVIGPDRVNAVSDAWAEIYGEDLGPRSTCRPPTQRPSDIGPNLRPPQPVQTIPGPVDQEQLLFGWTLPPGPHHADLGHVIAATMSTRFRRATSLRPSCGVVEMVDMNELYCVIELDFKADDPAHWRDRVATVVDGLWRKATDDHNYSWAATLAFHGKQLMRSRAGSRNIQTVSSRGHAATTALHAHRVGGVRREPTPMDGRNVAIYGMARASSDRMRAVHIVPTLDVASAGARYHAERGAESAPDEVVDRASLEASIRFPDLSGLQTQTLPNGVRVHILEDPRPDWPIVRLYVAGDNRMLAEPVEMDAAYSWLADPWSTASDVGGSQAYRQGRALWLDSTSSGWVWAAESAEPVWSIDVLGALFVHTDPLMLPRERKPVVKATLKSLAEDSQSPGYLAYVQRTRHLFGEHSPWLGEDAMTRWAEMPRSQAGRIVGSMRTPERTHLVVIGKVHPEKVMVAAQRSLAPWNPQVLSAPDAAAPDEAPMPSGSNTWVHASERPRAQTEVALSCRIDSDEPTAIGLLGRLLERQLNRDLRATRGLTYGVHPTTWRSTVGRGLDIEVQVPHDATGETVSALKSALVTLADGGADPAELNQLKLVSARQTALAYRSPDSLADLIFRSMAFENETVDPVAELEAVDPGTIAAILAPCVGAEAITLVGDADAIRDSLNAAGQPFVE